MKPEKGYNCKKEYIVSPGNRENNNIVAKEKTKRGNRRVATR